MCGRQGPLGLAVPVLRPCKKGPAVLRDPPSARVQGPARLPHCSGSPAPPALRGSFGVLQTED